MTAFYFPIDRAIPKEERRNVSLFCNVRESAVIEARDVDNIYAVPEAGNREDRRAVARGELKRPRLLALL